MPSGVQIKTPAGILTFEYDWTLEVPSGVTLISVQHFAPSPLVVVAEFVDTTALISKVTLSGGVHGGLYVPTAYAQLSTGESVPGRFTLRVMTDTV